MLKAYQLIAPALPYLVGTKKVCIWATDKEKYIFFENLGSLNVPLQLGSMLPEKSTPKLAMSTNNVIDRFVPRDVYGVTVRSVCYPVEGGTVGLTIDTEEQNQVIESLDQLTKVTRDVSINAVDIAERSNVVNQHIESMIVLTKLGTEKRQQLNEVTEVLFQMTERLKLLSINARIEASRAGKEGRTFTVVAEEVKRFADESKEKLTDIKLSIQGVNDVIVAVEKEFQTIEKHASSQLEGSQEISSFIQSISSSLEDLHILAKRIR